VEFNEEIHSKLCEVGIRFPEAVKFDADPQSPDVCDGSLATCTGTTNLLQRNVTDKNGNLVDVLIANDNSTEINPSDADSSSFFDFTSGIGESFSFVTQIVDAGNFAATLLLNTFTGGFVLDVLGTGILGVDFPVEFLTGIKILIGLAVVSWFAFLILGKQLF